MGAKQSKRSVDISGKEAESAGEVAAAGAGGEGRVEQIADVDTLKPQLNGDAHIQEPAEKEKQLDSGTPENEKDATTEKENKEQVEEQKEVAPVTNGDAEQKTENEESTPSPEDKKPKKEKVKKKWSLRSISFSRKDKPKQEKKPKEEDKTNGEPEKVLEEVADTSPETENNELAQEAKPESEIKEEKTPETPVTEPITNGSSTPETPKEETSNIEEPVEAKPENVISEPKVEPEQLPINGLSLEVSKSEVSELTKIDLSKIEESLVETSVPAPEIPVENEVCVEQMPLIEPTPPPLPETPPPSSVASFAATTMAPELTNASLANTADIVSNANTILSTKTDENTIDKSIVDIQCPNIQTTTEMVLNSIDGDEKPVEIITPEIRTLSDKVTETLTAPEDQQQPTTNNSDINTESPIDIQERQNNIESPKVTEETCDKPLVALNNDMHNHVENFPPPPMNESYINESNGEKLESISVKEEIVANDLVSETIITAESNDHEIDSTEKESLNKHNDSKNVIIENAECNGSVVEDKPLVNGNASSPVSDDLADLVKPATSPEDSMPPSLSDTLPQGGVDNDASESFPLPPSELCPSEPEVSPPDTPEPTGEAPSNLLQEPLLASDKMADLIPEVPVVPGLNIEMENSTDVAVAN